MEAPVGAVQPNVEVEALGSDPAFGAPAPRTTLPLEVILDLNNLAMATGSGEVDTTGLGGLLPWEPVDAPGLPDASTMPELFRLDDTDVPLDSLAPGEFP